MIPPLNFSGGYRLPVIRQNETAECGLACLAMIAGFYGFKTDLPALRRKFALGLQGMSFRDLIDIANKMELSTRPIKVPIDQIAMVRLPAIIHWDLNHFVVLKGIKRGKYIIHDPAFGARTIDHSEFTKHFTGVALELQPTEDFTKRTEKEALKLSDLWGRLFGLKRNLLQVFTLSIILQIFVLTSPFYLQLAVDEVLITTDANLLIVLALGFAGFTAINFISQIVRDYVILYFGSMLSFQIRRNLFQHLLRLPVVFFEKRHIGDIVSRFASTEPIQKMLTEGLIASLIDGLMAIVTLVLMYIYSPALASIALLAWLIYLSFRLALYQKFRSAQEGAIISRAQEQSTFMETVRSITSLKLFDGERERENFWQQKYADVINSNVKKEKYNIWFSGLNTGIFGIEHVLLIYVAINMILANEFTIGMIFAFLVYKRSFTEKASQLVEKYIEFRMLGLHLERIGDIALSQPEDAGNTPSSITEPHSITGNISVENITYRYSENTPNILSGVTFTVEAGQSIAITGPSGCGKTTILKTMTGLFQPTAGKVIIDGLPIEKYGLSKYRKQIGVVMQEDDLLTGSISENIAFFDPTTDMKRVIDAAKAAMIHEEIVAMPMQYESLVGDMGAALSGGQKQRIMLARALYKEPHILFMDEGTAHLDVATEQLVNQSISKLGITKIIIAHRPETIQSADRVLEFKNGELLEVQHHTSASKNSIYENVI